MQLVFYKGLSLPWCLRSRALGEIGDTIEGRAPNYSTSNDNPDLTPHTMEERGVVQYVRGVG